MKEFIRDLYTFNFQGGVIEALSMQKKWRGYSKDFEGSEKLVFCLKEPKNSCFSKKMPIKISIEQKDYNDHKIFQIAGYFPDRSCSIIDSSGNVIAKVVDFKVNGDMFFIYFSFLIWLKRTI